MTSEWINKQYDDLNTWPYHGTGTHHRPCHTGIHPILSIGTGTLYAGGWNRKAYYLPDMAVIDLTGTGPDYTGTGHGTFYTRVGTLNAATPAALSAFGLTLDAASQDKDKDTETYIGPWLNLPIRDFKTPDWPDHVWTALALEVRTLLRAGTDVLVACDGGHGRTGLTVSILAALLLAGDDTVSPLWHTDPVDMLRRVYCANTTETIAQELYVFDTLDLPVPDRLMPASPHCRYYGCDSDKCMGKITCADCGKSYHDKYAKGTCWDCRQAQSKRKDKAKGKAKGKATRTSYTCHECGKTHLNASGTGLCLACIRQGLHVEGGHYTQCEACLGWIETTKLKVFGDTGLCEACAHAQTTLPGWSDVSAETCPECAADQRGNHDPYCWDCGAPLDRASALTCPHCAAENSALDDICWACGLPLADSTWVRCPECPTECDSQHYTHCPECDTALPHATPEQEDDKLLGEATLAKLRAAQRPDTDEDGREYTQCPHCGAHSLMKPGRTDCLFCGEAFEAHTDTHTKPLAAFHIRCEACGEASAYGTPDTLYECPFCTAIMHGNGAPLDPHELDVYTHPAHTDTSGALPERLTHIRTVLSDIAKRITGR